MANETFKLLRTTIYMGSVIAALRSFWVLKGQCHFSTTVVDSKGALGHGVEWDKQEQLQQIKQCHCSTAHPFCVCSKCCLRSLFNKTHQGLFKTKQTLVSWFLRSLQSASSWRHHWCIFDAVYYCHNNSLLLKHLLAGSLCSPIVRKTSGSPAINIPTLLGQAAWLQEELTMSLCEATCTAPPAPYQHTLSPCSLSTLSSK